MPEKGKKADLMFVQHMLAVLKANGKMATIMPHGVLFRGGEEREARKMFIERGVLEAVIGLPANLFYGTGIPACILVMNKKDAKDRKQVLFINADREYREGKAQNFLRPEDIDKIVHCYRNMKDVDGYARLVPIDAIVNEDYNCNIRRYVDNAQPPEPHDVRAHLHGGVPKPEIESLKHFWKNYSGLRKRCFKPRPNDAKYDDFTEAIADKRAIAELVAEDPTVKKRHGDFLNIVGTWWQKNMPLVEALAPKNGKTGNVYALRRALLTSISDALKDQDLLTPYQVRGAFANYVNELKADLKSIAASGWGPELIPDDEILISQFPEILEQLEKDRARLAELEALFAAAAEEDFEDTDDTGVLPSDEVKALKAEIKEANTEAKLAKREKKDATKFIERVKVAEAALVRHKALEDEAKKLKADIRATENKKEELVEAAREKISRDEAKKVILERLQRQLINTYAAYIRADQRACVAAIENLWNKYAITARQIEKQRDEAAGKLKKFLVELGYE
jgi:type I restriction enzyme M protein